MGKQLDKRIELAKQVLDTTDKATLEAVENALLGFPPIKFSKKEIDEMEALADRVEDGQERTYTFAEVKRTALRSGRK